MKKIKNVIFIISFIIFDFAIWVIIGLILLNYEDFYEESKGEYFSLSSMTIIQKIGFFSYYIWIISNIGLGIFFLYRLINKYLLKK